MSDELEKKEKLEEIKEALKKHTEMIELAENIALRIVQIAENSIQVSSILNSIVESKNKILAEVEISIPQIDIDTQKVDFLLKAVDEFMDVNGFEYEKEEEPIYGSFFQKFKFWSKQPKTKMEVAEIYEKGKLSLEANYLNKPIAEATSELARASSRLISAASEFDEIVLRIGAILLVKVKINGKKKLLVETVSPEIIQKLEANPFLIKDPKSLYNILTGLNEQEKHSIPEIEEKNSTPSGSSPEIGLG